MEPFSGYLLPKIDNAELTFGYRCEQPCPKLGRRATTSMSAMSNKGLLPQNNPSLTPLDGRDISPPVLSIGIADKTIQVLEQ